MVKRRDVLRALGLGACAAPFGLSALRALADPMIAPQRLVLWPMMNGADPDRFWPSSGLSSEVLEPLARFADRTTLVRGIGIDGSDNHHAIRATFTGQPIGGYDDVDPAVRSLDQVVAAFGAHRAAVPSIHLGARPADAYEFYQLYGRSTLFFTPSGPVDYEASPVAAFDRFFGAPRTPVDPSGTDPSHEAHAIALAELDELEARATGLPRELGKLSQHRLALDALTTAAPPMPVAPSCGEPIASVEGLRSVIESPHDAYRDDLFSAVFDAHVDVAARAIACGLTNVVTLQAGSADGNVAVPVDGGLPHHTTSHGDPAAFARVQRWYSTKLARLVGALDVPDPLDPLGGTVLDNTCVLVLAECLPLSHESSGVPCFYVGGAGGRLRTGTTIDATGATNRHVLAAVARAFGVAETDRAHFGDDVLTEVLS